MRSLVFTSLALASLTTLAAADDTPDGTSDATSDTADAIAAAQPAVATPADEAAHPSTAMVAPAPVAAPAMGPRLRNGFSLSVGHEMGSGPSDGFSGQLYGLDWRIGMAINDNIAVYADTHLSFGTGQVGGASGATGNFAAAAIGEYTLPMRIFLGAGAGFGVLNNPSGPMLQARAGWYPFEKTSQGKARRLNVALDARYYLLDENIGTVSHYALSIGYDRF